jgi:hypothetical protein
MNDVIENTNNAVAEVIGEGQETTFITIPETKLPDGTIVPEFLVGRYLCTITDGKATVQANAVPTVSISYYDAVKACDAGGVKLIRETQALAIAWNIYNVAANWKSGTVGEGSLFHGLRNDSVDEAQSNEYISPDEDERRQFLLSTGERITDAAGHLFSWIFDDVQGDESGLIAKPFAIDSISISTAPKKSMENGIGWTPGDGRDWSGYALLRGGAWDGGGNAGVFSLGDAHPGGAYDYVGFRCTKSL